MQKENCIDIKEEISKKISDYEYILEITFALFIHCNKRRVALFSDVQMDVIINVIFGNRVRQGKGEDHCNSCRYVV